MDQWPLSSLQRDWKGKNLWVSMPKSEESEREKKKDERRESE